MLFSLRLVSWRLAIDAYLFPRGLFINRHRLRMTFKGTFLIHWFFLFMTNSSAHSLFLSNLLTCSFPTTISPIFSRSIQKVLLFWMFCLSVIFRSRPFSPFIWSKLFTVPRLLWRLVVVHSRHFLWSDGILRFFTNLFVLVTSGIIRTKIVTDLCPFC